MVDMIEYREKRGVFNCLWKVSLDSAGMEVSELEAGWWTLVGIMNSRGKAQQN